MLKIPNEIFVQKAKELGFSLVGFSQVELLQDDSVFLDKWLGSGFQASMSYMERNLEKRRDLNNILPGARTVISLGLNYFRPVDEKSGLRVSVYALGRDYHYVIWDRLKRLILEIKEIFPAFEALGYTDTGAIFERAWAMRSGMGWLGKNHCLITKEFGSWVFLSEIITNTEFIPSGIDKPKRHPCGRCRRCIDACPTGALGENGIFDAGKCISYLTIENKGDIPLEFKGKLNNCVFGCDICQSVCPYNMKFERITEEAEFLRSDYVFDSREIRGMTPGEFKKKFKESPILRAKLKGLLRNIDFIEK